jgi:ribosome-associated protein
MASQLLGDRLTRVIHKQMESRMDTLEFKLRGEHIALCDLLKLTGIADSGGQGKLMIANGEVTVDGQPESRKTAKIRANQTVRCLGQSVLVVVG